jgi:ribonuclease HI
MKKRWVGKHKALLHRIGPDKREVRVYTDGSLQHVQGVRLTGCGGIAYRGGAALFHFQSALGPCAKVYDAEMEGLARGAETLCDWLEGLGPHHSVRHIRFFADNTGALQRIYKGTPGYDQARSTRFRTAIHTMLDKNPLLMVELSWVPGHNNIHGNEAADKLAKCGASDQPNTPGLISAAFASNTYKRELRERWQRKWNARPSSNNMTDFSIANTHAPTTQPSKHFHKLKRKTFSRVIQCRTGHAHLGSYYQHMGIDEPFSCPCGAQVQSRSHVLLDCVRHITHRHLLADKNNVTSINSILGSTEGIQRLATFITASHAFEKPPTLPPE